MSKKRFFSILFILLLIFTGCSGNNGKINEEKQGELSAEKLEEESSLIENAVNPKEYSIYVEGEGFPKTVIDYQNEEIVIEEPFERPAVLSGTPLTIWYDLGGKSICTSDISENLKLDPKYEDEIKNLPEIGPVYSINMESVLSNQPDLIIAQKGTQGKQADQLRNMGYNVITTSVRTFEDVIETYRAFGKLLDSSDLAEERINFLTNRKDELANKAPDDGKNVVILYVTANNIAAKLNNSIAGDIANLLKINNVLKDSKPDNIGSEHTPLDVEFIASSNPDVILVTSMVSDNEEAKRIIYEEFATNPVWDTISAIKEDRIVFLPQQYFLFNAGPFYDEAIEYMARGVYPEIYGDLDDFTGR